AWQAPTDWNCRRSPGWIPSLLSPRRMASSASLASSDQGRARASAWAWSTSAGVMEVLSLGVWSRSHNRRCRPAAVRMGRTLRLSKKRSNRAASSWPPLLGLRPLVGGSDHQLERHPDEGAVAVLEDALVEDAEEGIEDRG